jgi:hypothetical protein
MKTKLKPHKIKWDTVDVAATWPEGCTTMEVLWENGKPNYAYLEGHRWHRPDWLQKSHVDYKYYTKYRYCLLALPTNDT